MTGKLCESWHVRQESATCSSAKRVALKPISCLFVCRNVEIHTYTYIYIYIYIQVYTQVYWCICIYLYICLCVHACLDVCICIYLHTHASIGFPTYTSMVGGNYAAPQPGNLFCVRACFGFEVETNLKRHGGLSRVALSIFGHGIFSFIILVVANFPLRLQSKWILKESKWDEVRPHITMWSQVCSCQFQWDQGNPSDTRWNQFIPKEVIWNELKPIETQWNPVQPSNTKWNMGQTSNILVALCFLSYMSGSHSLISLGATDHAVTTVNHIAALGNIVCCWFAPTMNFKNHEWCGYVLILQSFFFRACGRSWWTEDNQNDVLLVCLRYMASTGR